MQVILCPTCPPFIFFLSLSLPAPPTTLSILSLLTFPLLSSIRLHFCLYLSLCLTFASFPVFIHPALSLYLLSATPHPTISHLSSLLSLPPTHTQTIYCRLVKQRDWHNSPDKGIETLNTYILHEELKILQKKDVLLSIWQRPNKDTYRRRCPTGALKETRNKNDDINFLWCTPGFFPWSYTFVSLCVAIRLHHL